MGRSAVAAIAERSGGVYQLHVGRVKFNVPRRRFSVDSLHVVTNDAINAGRPQPLATLDLAFHHCTVSGVHLLTLLRRNGLIADSFICRAASAAVVVPPGIPDTATELLPGPYTFLVLPKGLTLPRFAPLVRIAQVDFPQVGLDFRLQRARRGDARLEVEHLRWRMVDVVIDAADTAAAARPLFSRKIDLAATNFLAIPSSGNAVRVEGLVGSVTDSTVELRGLSFTPTLSDSAFARSRPYRRDLVKTSVGRIAVEGLDVGAFVLGRGLRARGVELDSLRVEVTSEKGRPRNPRQPRHRSPQGWLADDLDRTLRVDSVRVRNGEVIYREQRPGRARPGVLSFARIDAVATNVRHVVGRRTVRDTMLFWATAHLQNTARLDVQVATPLDAPRFTMSLRGTLGTMLATALNPLVQEVFPMRITKGRVLGVNFRFRVANGIARGTITPRYRNLALEVTGRGSEGILGGGGVIGDAARGVATLVGNWSVRGDNPEEPGKPPLIGVISRPFAGETLPSFLWLCLRDGLMAVVRN